jgi:2-hydroxychromene-2-carboxylate isomerase
MAQERVIEFFFDIGSPYSYLAATQMEALAARARTPVRWRPFLLGAVFKATGNTMPAAVPNKARWMLEDLQRWAERYGVPFRMSTLFPLNTLRTQRALVAAARIHGEAAVPPFALALYRAYWVQDRDVSADAEIAACAAEAHLDAASVLAAIDAPETKEALRAATDEAVARGAFGAPAIFVGDALFWGNDRLVLVEDHLARQA